MKFNCGDPTARYQEYMRRAEEERRRQADWHVAFAWLPVRVTNTSCVWLERYERRIHWAVSERSYEWEKFRIDARQLKLTKWYT